MAGLTDIAGQDDLDRIVAAAAEVGGESFIRSRSAGSEPNSQSPPQVTGAPCFNNLPASRSGAFRGHATTRPERPC
jgi:hypothetical protein